MSMYGGCCKPIAAGQTAYVEGKYGQYTQYGLQHLGAASLGAGAMNNAPRGYPATPVPPAPNPIPPFNPMLSSGVHNPWPNGRPPEPAQRRIYGSGVRAALKPSATVSTGKKNATKPPQAAPLAAATPAPVAPPANQVALEARSSRAAEPCWRPYYPSIAIGQNGKQSADSQVASNVGYCCYRLGEDYLEVTGVLLINRQMPLEEFKSLVEPCCSLDLMVDLPLSQGHPRLEAAYQRVRMKKNAQDISVLRDVAYTHFEPAGMLLSISDGRVDLPKHEEKEGTSTIKAAFRLLHLDEAYQPAKDLNDPQANIINPNICVARFFMHWILP